MTGDGAAVYGMGTMPSRPGDYFAESTFQSLPALTN